MQTFEARVGVRDILLYAVETVGYALFDLACNRFGKYRIILVRDIGRLSVIAFLVRHLFVRGGDYVGNFRNVLFERFQTD